MRLHEEACFQAIWSSRFFLRHVMRTNVPGNVLFATIGVVVLLDPERRASLRAVAGFDALTLVLSACWHTRFWDTPTAVESFLAESRDHYLSRTPLKAAGIMVLVASLYVVFVGLFAWQFSLVGAVTTTTTTTTGYARGYCVAGLVWHTWCSILLLLAAVIRRFYEADGTTTNVNVSVVSSSARTDIAQQRPLRPLSVTLTSATPVPIVR